MKTSFFGGLLLAAIAATSVTAVEISQAAPEVDDGMTQTEADIAVDATTEVAPKGGVKAVAKTKPVKVVKESKKPDAAEKQLKKDAAKEAKKDKKDAKDKCAQQTKKLKEVKSQFAKYK